MTVDPTALLMTELRDLRRWAVEQAHAITGPAGVDTVLATAARLEAFVTSGEAAVRATSPDWSEAKRSIERGDYYQYPTAFGRKPAVPTP